MAEFVQDLFSRITGNENFLRCLKLCEIEQFSELIGLSESTFDQMELYIQKKCTQMPFNERSNYVGYNFAKNPNSFKFSPGVRQKILSLTKNLCSVFSNDGIPVSTNNVKEICQRFVDEHMIKSLTFPTSAIKSVMPNANIHSQLVPINQISNQFDLDEPVITKITHGNTNKQPRVSYNNIFQRLDMFSKELTVSDATDNIVPTSTEKHLPFINIQDNNESNKENANKNEMTNDKILKRKAEMAPASQEKVVNQLHKHRKLKKNSLKRSTKVARTVILSDEIRTYNSTRSRTQQFSSEKHDLASVPSQIKAVTPPRIKRKYTKRLKPNQVEVLVIENGEKLPSHLITSESPPNKENYLIEGNPNENSKEPSKSTKKLLVKDDKMNSILPVVPLAKMDIENATNGQAASDPTRTVLKQSIPPEKIPIKLISTNSQLTKGVPPPKSVKVILQSNPFNGSLSLSKPARITELVGGNVLAAIPIIPQVSVGQMDKPKGPPRLQLSDAPFQCFDTNVNKKKQTKKYPSKLTNGMPNNPMKLTAQSKILPINQPIKTKRKKPLPISFLFKTSPEKFKENEVEPLAKPLVPVFKLEPVPTETTSPTRANLFEQLLDSTIDPNMNPQWTSTPYFNANRFINSTKHQKQISSDDSRTLEGSNK